MSVVFVARVITGSGDTWGTRRAKVVIEEPLQNVPGGETEAMIDTASGTSCYFPLKAGERYVIITIAGKYTVHACSSSFQLRGNEHILEALREGLKNGRPTLIGSIYRRSGRYSTNGFLSGVTVSAEGSDHKVHSVTTDGSGHYRFAGLQAGTYWLRVTKPGYVADDDFNKENNGLPTSHLILEKAQPEPGRTEVSTGTCTFRNLAMWPRGAISGIVRDQTGTPIRGVRVQAFAFDEKNKRDTDSLRSAITTADGSYAIEPLPPGSFAIGVNGKRYYDEDVYPPTFHDGGRAVYVTESGSTKGVNLVLPPPRVTAHLVVTVLDPDGTPHSGATIRLDDQMGEQRAFTREKTNVRGEITLTVYVGEQYSVRAFHYVNRSEFEGVAPLTVTNTTPRLTIQMKKRR